jgi:hypothetical protein
VNSGAAPMKLLRVYARVIVFSCLRRVLSLFCLQSSKRYMGRKGIIWKVTRIETITISHVRRFHIGSHFEMTESIGDYILRTIYIFHCWSKFFYDETPSHDALGIKILMSKVLMGCVDHNLLT